MIEPDTPDPYVDEVPHNPGEPVPEQEQEQEQEAPDWPEGQVPPEEQSDG
ncbi:hypothetical protein [Pseudomonas asiatica]